MTHHQDFMKKRTAQLKAIHAKNLKGKLSKNQQIDFLRNESIAKHEADVINFSHTDKHKVFVPLTVRPFRTQAGLTAERAMSRHELHSNIGRKHFIPVDKTRVRPTGKFYEDERR